MTEPTGQAVIPEGMDQAERDKRMARAYTAATRELREANRDEFNKLYAAKCLAEGIEWTPRLSKTDRALADTIKLLDENPELADRLALTLAQRGLKD